MEVGKRNPAWKKAEFEAIVSSATTNKDAVDLYLLETTKLSAGGNRSMNAGAPKLSSNVTIAPRLSDYLQGGEFYACGVDSARRKCTLGRIFKSVNDSAIVKIGSLKSSLKDVSCLCVISEDIIAVGGRFSPIIELYRLQDRQVLAKIDTKAVQGVKSLLVIRKQHEEITEWGTHLIVGTYSDDKTLPSFKIDILRRFAEGQEPLSLSVKTGRVYDKSSPEAAVTALA